MSLPMASLWSLRDNRCWNEASKRQRCGKFLIKTVWNSRKMKTPVWESSVCSNDFILGKMKKRLSMTSNIDPRLPHAPATTPTTGHPLTPHLFLPTPGEVVTIITAMFRRSISQYEESWARMWTGTLWVCSPCHYHKMTAGSLAVARQGPCQPRTQTFDLQSSIQKEVVQIQQIGGWGLAS